MATSSIFTEVRIDTPERLAAFSKALAKAEKDAELHPAVSAEKAPLTDMAKLRKIMAKRMTEK
ncbi:MAG: hypothetical protein IJ493_07215 [Clostridia bacterium]|nr:hypothetical protein [Clostridia bacterium]